MSYYLLVDATLFLVYSGFIADVLIKNGNDCKIAVNKSCYFPMDNRFAT